MGCRITIASAYPLTTRIVSASVSPFAIEQASTLPTEVPFGFDPYGQPESLVPPTRLLLLPMIAGFCWLVDLAIGLWLYRRDDQRPLAYGLWGISVLVAGLLWGASLHILAASG